VFCAGGDEPPPMLELQADRARRRPQASAAIGRRLGSMIGVFSGWGSGS
jgi:hypothetical protein